MIPAGHIATCTAKPQTGTGRSKSSQPDHYDHTVTTKARLLLANFLQVFALWGIAVAQPILSVLGDNTATFVTHGIAPRSILWFVALLVVVPPVILLGVEIIASFSKRVLAYTHILVLSCLAMIAILQVMKSSIGLEGFWQLLAAVLVTGCVVALVLYYESVGQWLRLLAVVPLIAGAMFIFNTPAGRYARSSAVSAFEVEAGNTPVIFVMFDEFPTESLLGADGKIDSSLFPNFARLAGISTWYRNYSTTAETTDIAVPSVLSGRLPNFQLSSTYVDHPENLFSLLGSSYKMNVSELVTQLCSPNICSDDNSVVGVTTNTVSSDWNSLFSDVRALFRQRIDLTKKNEFDALTDNLRQNDIPHTVTETTQPQDPVSSSSSPKSGSLHNIPAVAYFQAGRWNDWISRINTGTKPSLNYIHLLMPHQPWLFYPDGSAYFSSEGEQFEDEAKWDVSVRRQRHLLQLRYLDILVGQLLDHLQSTGLLDKSLLVVTADHGVAFEAGFPRRYLSGDYRTYPDIIYPPLFVHTPDQDTGSLSDINIENIDVLPLLATILDVKVPWTMDGHAPEFKSEANRAKKTLYLHPRPYGMKARPDLMLTINSDEGLRSMLSRRPKAGKADDYLFSLYGDTPFNYLRGKSITELGVDKCACTAVIDKDLLSIKPLLLLRGGVSGQVKVGDWLAIIVNGKVSGLSQVFKRGNGLRFSALVRREDYGSADEIPLIYRINTDGSLLSKLKNK